MDDYVLISWGDWDKNQLIDEHNRNKMDYAWLNPHMNLKEQYHILKNKKKPLGFKTAMRLEGLQIDGIHHRGIDDAFIISKIFEKYFEFWRILD